ncbi:extracellular solute-binding protein [Paenibacillus ginsengarvi]|uniref:Extracellular solute-binding protein n=1 Tax=Paenibacillus ginsengarvi TaxID=400777 RepID=A0A3B0BSY8_9BACL|nr:extracellular solute-binding protein [Paenibacillus ginsengarvi]RKN76032.1 extracellular solute-binding protein [Paenibacillus ginsengarvi]
MARTKTMRRLYVLPLALTLLAASACSSGSSGTATKDSQSGAAAQKVTITVARSADPPAVLTEENPAIKYLQDKIGAEFKFEMYPSNLYAEKIRVKLAGGDIPDAFVWNLGLDSLVMSLIQADKIVPLDSYIAQYPGLKSLEKYNRVRYDGKIWAITGAINPVNSSDIPLIRQDWLESLKLPMPKTTDDLLKVATAFAKNDPDKNGKNDTYGITLSNGFLEPGLEGTNGIAQAFGLDNAFMKQANGKYVPQIADPRFKEFLDWMQKAYAAGAIDPDFITTDASGSNSKISSQGTAGLIFSYGTLINALEEPNGLKKKDPNAKLVPMEAIVGPHGDRGAKARVSLAGIFISKSAASNPQKMKKIMEWLEWGTTKEGEAFSNYGVEGVDYTKDASRNINVNKDAYAKNKPSTLLYTRTLQPTAEVGVSKQTSQETQELVSKAAVMNEPYLKYTTTSEAYSPKLTKYRSEIQSFIVENVSKAIIGKIQLSQWDQVVKDWYSRFEGDKIVDEVTEFMKKM